jgi:hypothetical protein
MRIVTGLVILVYDHFVTFSSERRLIWTAPSSIAKFGFLINRYVVPVGMFITFIFLSGFIGLDVANQVRLRHTERHTSLIISTRVVAR